MWKEHRQEEPQQEQPLYVANSIDSHHNKREEEIEIVWMKAENEWDLVKIDGKEKMFYVTFKPWAMSIVETI